MISTGVLFQYLRCSLGIETEIPILTPYEWNAFYQFCVKQRIIGLGFNLVEKTEKEKIPPKKMVLKWFSIVHQIECQNNIVNQRCLELQNFFSQEGYKTCILKGQGNASLYDTPLRRQSGDIDIWLNGNTLQILSLLKKRGILLELGYHHAEISIFKDVKVEVHYRPIWLNSPCRNHFLQRWFRNQSLSQLKDNTGVLNFPDTSFNVVYQLVHIFNHFLQEGIGLRQIIDYYYVLMNCSDREMTPVIHKIGLEKFAGAIMYVMKVVFNIPASKMICDLKEKEGRFLLEEIMRSGDFGRFDERNTELMSKKGLIRKVYQIKRGFRYLKYYPEEVLCTPFRLYHVIWRIMDFWKYETH